MDEKLKFITDCLSGELSMAEACRRHGVSRKTGYKWLSRYRESGVDGLKDVSRAPHAHPNAVGTAMEDAVLALKRKHMLWGPRKVRDALILREPQVAWPAASTIGGILDRNGLVVGRRRRGRATPSSAPLAHCASSNDVWCVDFKGWFRTGDGARCDPLTITDGATRYLVRCVGMGGGTDFAKVKPLFEAAFREYGLPRAIRSDNGPPFASTGLAGLSRLSVWWIRLGIRPERIRPGKPQENGRHERMHRTLKEATASPPAATLRAQQRAFDEFRAEYNHERPHEALGGRPPAELYSVSATHFPSRFINILDYYKDIDVRKVKRSGEINWGGAPVYLTEALVGEFVGLQPAADGLWTVRFADLPLGVLDERRHRVRPLPPPAAHRGEHRP
jgi:transposase InsO family protein